MTRSTAVFRLALAVLSAGSITASAVAAQDPAVTADQRADDDALYTVEELDNLLAPIALYPDPILADLFIAATYPEQIALAQRYVENYGSDDVDNQAWDRSVKSIARYGPVLNMLAERPNWATAVGRAYATQPGDVMASVQNLRRMARAQGNLQSTEQQRVEVEREYIRIVPAQPRVIYVPVYDPYVVYYRPIDYVRVSTPYWSFGIGYPIGAWLAYDCDWDTRVVYYHGWDGYGRHAWYAASRPYFGYNAYWMGPRITVIINHNVRYRHVNYGGFGGYYNTVHRNTSWDRPRMPGRGAVGRPGIKQAQPDRYGIPVGRDASVGRPDKNGTERGNVPRAGGSVAGNGGDRANGGDRGNAGGRANGGARGSGDRASGGRATGGSSSDIARAPVSEDRVKPVRVGGNRRPLYPGNGEDISADRVRGGVPARRDASGDNGSWNPRAQQPERAAPRTEGFGGMTASAPRTRDRDADPVRIPRASEGISSRGNGASNESRSTPRYEPRTETRSAPRTERSYEPRVAPRSEPRYEPRSAPRTERSVEPRSAPRVSEPRMSAPRASAPRESAPRASAPRESAPRSSAPRASGSSRGSSSSSVPRAPRGRPDRG